MRALKQTPLVDAISDQDLRTLIVGDMRRWATDGRDTEGDARFTYTSFSSLSPELMRNVQPEMVLSALVSNDFDAIDLARHLSDLGFQGSYRVIAQRVPDVAIIRAEVALVAPDLDFDVYELPGAVDR